MKETSKSAANSTFARGGLSRCGGSADSFVVAKCFVLRINFSDKNLAHRYSANHMPGPKKNQKK